MPDYKHQALEAYAVTVAAVPHWLFLFPAIAGGAWMITLTTMLIYWFALGRPSFPGQGWVIVPYISEIGATAIKPFFILGCAVTAVCFFGTVFSVHYARQAHRFYGSGVDEAAWRKLLTAISLVAGVLASGSLLTLSIMDTISQHEVHETSLMATFGGLTIAAICTAAIWSDVWLGGEKREEAKEGGRKHWIKDLKTWCAVNFSIMVVIFCFTVAFIVENVVANWGVGAVLEWCLSYFGSCWLLSFIGFLLYMEKDDEKDLSDIEEEVMGTHGERQPLLTDN